VATFSTGRMGNFQPVLTFANYSLQRAFCAEIKGRRPHTFPRVRMLESEIHE
jgi:hypothetical protein